MLEVTDLHVNYGNVEAVRGVDLTLEPGQVTLVLGPNGAGKSSMLGAIAGTVKAASGVVRLDGDDLTGRGAHRVIRSGIALVPEGRRVFGPLTIEENLRLGGYISSKDAVRRTMSKVYEMFPILHERRHSAAGLLSGGEQQMLAFGRAMMSQPTYMLLDEPSMGLAPAVVDIIVEKVGQLALAGIGILMVEQNTEAGLEIAHEVKAVTRGEIVFSGTADDVATNASVLRAFLGESAIVEETA
jgi:branched-chain amino acid transport system ATP-binding protein